MTLQLIYHSANAVQADQSVSRLRRIVAWGLTLVAVFCNGFASGAQWSSDMIPLELRCEYAVDLIAVDAVCPRLSWRLESPERGAVQTAHQIVAASSRELLIRGHGDLWDSGMVLTNQSVAIAYQGTPLKSSQLAYWKVRVWDRSGRPSA